MSTSLIAVFIPLLMMGGIVGRLFREFAVTLSVAILMSLVGFADDDADDVRDFPEAQRQGGARLALQQDRSGVSRACWRVMSGVCGGY